MYRWAGSPSRSPRRDWSPRIRRRGGSGACRRPRTPRDDRQRIEPAPPHAAEQEAPQVLDDLEQRQEPRRQAHAHHAAGPDVAAVDDANAAPVPTVRPGYRRGGRPAGARRRRGPSRRRGRTRYIAKLSPPFVASALQPPFSLSTTTRFGNVVDSYAPRIGRHGTRYSKLRAMRRSLEGLRQDLERPIGRPVVDR